MHNTKVIDNSCGGTAFQKDVEPNNMAHFMHTVSNYSTYYSGKYLNSTPFLLYPSQPSLPLSILVSIVCHSLSPVSATDYGSANVGGTEHIPTGWTSWHALVGNSK
jgi:hypothetical protein